MPRAIMLSGKVVIDDGTVPQESVVIERVCGATRRTEGQTDSNGRFSFQPGRRGSMLLDAGEGLFDVDPLSSGSSPAGNSAVVPMGANSRLDPKLIGCELRAVLPGFRSDAVSLTNRRVMDNPDVGTIVLHRLANVDGTMISTTSLAAPKDARKAYAKGLDAVKKGQWPEARKSFEKAVDLYPKYAAAWYELGGVALRQNDVAGAQKALARAIEADPRYLKPYIPASMLFIQKEQWQQAADATETLIRLDPVDYPLALMYNAVANINLHRMDLAEKSAREAVRIDTERRVPRAQYVLGFILANKREYSGALEQMKGYVASAPNAPDAGSVRKQIAELEKVVGQLRAAPAEPKQP